MSDVAPMLPTALISPEVLKDAALMLATSQEPESDAGFLPFSSGEGRGEVVLRAMA